MNLVSAAAGAVQVANKRKKDNPNILYLFFMGYLPFCFRVSVAMIECAPGAGITNPAKAARWAHSKHGKATETQ